MYYAAQNLNTCLKGLKIMILDVHVAFLFASLSVLFGITYTVGQFLNRCIDDAQTKKLAGVDPDTDLVERDTVFLS